MSTPTNNFYSRILGKLLGDGSIVKQEGRKPRFKFQHRIEDVGWTSYCYEQLKDDIPLNKPAYRKNTDSRLKKGYSELYYVQSKTAPLITGLYELWYPNGLKTLPFEFIECFLNVEALSWWYQDDGHLKISNDKMQKIILSTDSFTKTENVFLQSLLYHKWQLSFKLDQQNRLILYDQFQIIYFLHLVEPWLQPCMKRKAPIVLPLRPIANRTTIYLPETIQLTSPTKEIHEALKHLHLLFKNKQSQSICYKSLFNTLQPILESTTPTKSYQINIREPYKTDLAYLRQQTGATVSELVEWCFDDNRSSSGF